MSAKGVFAAAAFIAFIVLAAILSERVWDECRAHGHSILYCIAVTGR